MRRREVIGFYRDWWEAFQDLPDDVQLAAFRAICLYGFDSITPEDVMVNSLTKVMQKSIDRNDKKLEAIREKRRTAANTRWSKSESDQQNQSDADGCKCIDVDADGCKCIDVDADGCKCIDVDADGCKCISCNANDAIININKNINKNNINIKRESIAHTREECEGGAGGTIFDKCCELFTSEAEREYQVTIASKYGITDLRQAFAEFREILIERHLLSDVKSSQDFSRLFIYKYCLPRQKQQINNKHGTINRQTEFAQYIADKLAASGTPEPDISNNY